MGVGLFLMARLCEDFRWMNPGLQGEVVLTLKQHSSWGWQRKIPELNGDLNRKITHKWSILNAIFDDTGGYPKRFPTMSRANQLSNKDRKKPRSLDAPKTSQVTLSIAVCPDLWPLAQWFRTNRWWPPQLVDVTMPGGPGLTAKDHILWTQRS